MSHPLLTVKYRGTGSTRVLSLTGTITEQIGDDVPSSLEPINDIDDQVFSNRAINAFGGVYALFEDGLYKLQTGSAFGEWSKAAIDGGFSFSAGASGQSTGFGMWYGVSDGVPYLFGAYLVGDVTDTTTRQYRGWRFNLLTDTAEETVTLNGQAISTRAKGTIFYNNTAWIQASNSGNNTELIQVTLDPLSISRELVSVNGTGDSPNGTCFDVFLGNLYMVTAQDLDTDSTQDWVVSKLTAGTFQSIISFADQANNIDAGSKACLFNDGTSQYVIYYDVVTSGWRMYQLDVVSGEISLGSELTSTVLPAVVQAGGAAANATGRWWPWKEQQSDGSFEIILYYAPDGDASTTLTRFRFVDNATQLEQVSTGGGDASLALPEGTQGGGHRMYIPEAATATAYQKERVTGGERITFRVHPPINSNAASVTTGLIAKLFVGSNGGVATTQVQLTGSVTGGSATRNGNQVENLDADNTDYTAIIQAAGIEDFELADLVVQISAS